MPHQGLVLLDDAHSTSNHPTSRLYHTPVAHWRATTAADVAGTLAAIEEALAGGLFVTAAFSYELGELLQGLSPKTSATPFIDAYGFSNVQRLAKDAVDAWLAEQLENMSESEKTAGVTNIESSLDSAMFGRDIAEIRNRIAQGETYQVNHTFRIYGQTFGSPLALYQRLRQRQPSRFGAFMDMGDWRMISVSPEWFLSCRQGMLTSKPMKGTLPASSASADALANDAKNRAENLMIVDLIRNDLGRISDTGSVRVPNMFEVEQFGEVLQMTSTITARMRADTPLQGLLTATLPCGSVTGAPKKNTMKIIQSLEPSPRGIYCGAIGWFDPPDPSNSHAYRLGDFSMSVAIRTLEENDSHRFVMGVGAGITIDSEQESEWQECMAKAKFLTGLPIDLGLIETLRIENGKPLRLNSHLARLAASAKALGMRCNLAKIQFEIDSTIKEYLQDRSVVQTRDGHARIARMRLLLRPNGGVEVHIDPLDELVFPQKVFWAKDLLPETLCKIDSRDPLLAHKTTRRAAYDQAWQAAKQWGGFDALFTNERGEVTEGGRTNLLIKTEGKWRTPAQSSGVLPGIMRSALLADPHMQVEETVIYMADVLGAEEILLVNSLRGLIPVVLENAPQNQGTKNATF